MPLFFEVHPVKRVNQLISDNRSFRFLEILDYAVGREGVGDGAAVFVGYSC